MFNFIFIHLILIFQSHFKYLLPYNFILVLDDYFMNQISHYENTLQIKLFPFCFLYKSCILKGLIRNAYNCICMHICISDEPFQYTTFPNEM